MKKSESFLWLPAKALALVVFGGSALWMIETPWERFIFVPLAVGVIVISFLNAAPKMAENGKLRMPFSRPKIRGRGTGIKIEATGNKLGKGKTYMYVLSGYPPNEAGWVEYIRHLAQNYSSFSFFLIEDQTIAEKHADVVASGVPHTRTAEKRNQRRAYIKALEEFQNPGMVPIIVVSGSEEPPGFGALRADPLGLDEYVELWGMES